MPKESGLGNCGRVFSARRPWSRCTWRTAIAEMACTRKPGGRTGACRSFGALRALFVLFYSPELTGRNLHIIHNLGLLVSHALMSALQMFTVVVPFWCRHCAEELAHLLLSFFLSLSLSCFLLILSPSVSAGAFSLSLCQMLCFLAVSLSLSVSCSLLRSLFSFSLSLSRLLTRSRALSLLLHSFLRTSELVDFGLVPRLPREILVPALQREYSPWAGQSCSG